MSHADKPISPNHSHNALPKGAEGMTLLEYYAGLAMNGILGGDYGCPHLPQHFEAVAQGAVLQAKALIAELEKVQQ